MVWTFWKTESCLSLLAIKRRCLFVQSFTY